MKRIDFPEEEIPTISKQNRIITHRVSNDYGKYVVGDRVMTPWNAEYLVTGLKSINSIFDSPFAKYLTDEQLDFLSKFDKIDVLRIEKYDGRIQ